MKYNTAFVASMLILTLPNVRADEPTLIKDRINRLENFPLVERDRVDRNIQIYQSLTSDQKKQFRQLHEELIKDRQQGGSLLAVLDSYVHWLNTLSPVQREELQQESDPNKKILLVRQFMEDQERRFKEENDRLIQDFRENSGTAIDSAAGETPTEPKQNNSGKRIQLNKKELTAAMRVIRDDLPADKKTGEFESLPIFKYTTILHDSILLRQTAQEWPDKTLIKKLADQIPKKKVEAILATKDQKDTEREVVISFLLTGILKHANDSLYKPNDEDRRKALESLTPPERARFDVLVQPDAKKWFLNRKYFEQKGDQSQKEVHDCHREIFDLFHALNVTPPPWLPRPIPVRNRSGQIKN